jgi:hypothetical protein
MSVMPFCAMYDASDGESILMKTLARVPSRDTARFLLTARSSRLTTVTGSIVRGVPGVGRFGRVWAATLRIGATDANATTSTSMNAVIRA